MTIAPVNAVTPKVQTKTFATKPENDNKNVKDVPAEKKYTKKQVSGMVLASALSAAVLAGGAVKKAGSWKLSKLQSEVTDLRGVRDALQTAQQRVESLTGDNKKLQEEADIARNKLKDLFEGNVSPSNARDKIRRKLEQKINGELNYDISTPPVTGKADSTKKIIENKMQLPDCVGTTNRAGSRDLLIPEIASDGRFKFELPMSDEVKITRMTSKDFTPVKNQMTNISEDYAQSVQWSNDKIARDILQNFFDGHGQTLDGVKLDFAPTANGKFKVRIEGKSTYTPDKAVYIGESTKRDDARAAGNYGEGLKMAVLKLLKDGGSTDVKIASDNWKLTYNLAEGNLSDKRVLSYSLDKVGKYDGNYLEFETSDRDLLESLKKTINRFYHSNNPDFRCPDFENDKIGIKILPEGQKGGFYIAGQRFEVDNDYEGLNGVSIFIKEKPPVEVLDPSRDRTSLNKSNLSNIASWLGRYSSGISDPDKLKIIKSLEKYWNAVDKSNEAEFLKKFVFWADHIKVDFPEKFVAYSPASPELVMDLVTKGYEVCHNEFAGMGMQTIKDLMGDARAHEVVMPNAVQKKKILILKEALQKLSIPLKDKHFTADELDTKIFLFDNKSAKDSKLHSDALAEAITDRGVSKGFWIDKSYLDRADLYEVLETALHELSHKVGGDESMEFSYKLTDVNRDTIAHILNNSADRVELQELSSIWKNLS